MATHSNKDTYLAMGVTLMVIGALTLLGRLIDFSSFGMKWLLSRDSMLLFAAVVFLLLKRDKSVGIVLLAILAMLNIDFIFTLLGTYSYYVLPAALLLAGILLFVLYKR